MHLGWLLNPELAASGPQGLVVLELASLQDLSACLREPPELALAAQQETGIARFTTPRLAVEAEEVDCWAGRRAQGGTSALSSESYELSDEAERRPPTAAPANLAGEDAQSLRPRSRQLRV